MRLAAFWFWFAVAVISLGRLWATFQEGFLAHASAADAAAFVALALALWLIGRAQVRAARAERIPHRS